MMNKSLSARPTHKMVILQPNIGVCLAVTVVGGGDVSSPSSASTAGLRWCSLVSYRPRWPLAH
jgi:hypothetical protein